MIFTKHAKYVAVIVIGALLPFLFYLYQGRAQFFYKDNTLSIMKGDVRTFDTDNLIKNTLKPDIWIAVVVECDDIFDPSCFYSYNLMMSELNEMPKMAGLLGLSNILIPAMIENGQLKPRFELLVPRYASYDEINWKAISKNALGTSYIKNLIVSEDMTASVSLCLFNDTVKTKKELDGFVLRLDTVLDKYRSEKLKIYTVGLPMIKKELQDSLLDNLLFKGLLGLLAVLVCLWFVCRKIRLMINLINCILINLIFCLFLCSIFDLQFDYFLALLIPIVLAVQITFLIHFYIVLQRIGRESGEEEFHVIVQKALGEVIRPSLTACLTTAAGFVSFTFSEVDELALFGQCGAIACLISLFISYGPGVSILVAFSPRKIGKVKAFKRRKSMWPLILNKKISVLIGFICLVSLLFSIFSLSHIRTDERAIQYLPVASKVRQGITIMSEKFGGVHLFKIELDTGVKNGLNEVATLSVMAKLHKRLVALEGISAVYSYAGLISEVHKKMKEAVPLVPLSFLVKLLIKGVVIDEMSVPNTMGIRFIDQIMQKYNPSGLELLVDQERQKATLIVRSLDMPTGAFVDLMDDAMAAIEQEEVGAIKIKLVKDKDDYLMKEKQIQKSLFDSYFFSVIPIFLLLCILFRSLSLSLLAIMCNGISVVLMLGLLVKFDFVLNSITVMAGSIAFSIAIDDSIHLIKNFQALILNHSFSKSLIICYEQKGRAVVGTSMLICAVAIFLTTIDFPPISSFGWLLFSAILIALFVNLFILPLGFWLTSYRRESLKENEIKV